MHGEIIKVKSLTCLVAPNAIFFVFLDTPRTPCFVMDFVSRMFIVLGGCSGWS